MCSAQLLKSDGKARACAPRRLLRVRQQHAGGEGRAHVVAGGMVKCGASHRPSGIAAGGEWRSAGSSLNAAVLRAAIDVLRAGLNTSTEPAGVLIRQAEPLDRRNFVGWRKS
jgi:hypothetical protein